MHRKEVIIENIKDILINMSVTEIDAIYKAICKLKGIKKR